MRDWIGALYLREHTPDRVVLALSRSTRIVGLVLVLLGAYLGLLAWARSPLWTLLPALVVLSGAVLLTVRREFVFDRADGVLRIDRRALFIGTRAVVPLFHLRAVVIEARSGDGAVPLAVVTPSRYLAFIDRRVGGAIYLDERRHCAALLAMAEAIAEVADLRLEYDATSCVAE